MNKLPRNFWEHREYSFLFLKDLSDSQPVIYNVKNSKAYVGTWLQALVLDEIKCLVDRPWFIMIERDPSTNETRSVVCTVHINVEIAGARDFKK